MMSRCFPRLLAFLLLPATLVGCASWLGSGDAGEHPSIYAPVPSAKLPPHWQASIDSLLIATPSAAPMLGSQRIVVRLANDELQFLHGARWAQPAPELLQDTLLHLLEDGGALNPLARQGSGLSADWLLLLDLRRFEADYRQGAVPTIEIVVSAKLVSRQDPDLVIWHLLSHSEPAAASSTEAIIAAFSEGLSQINLKLAHWLTMANN